MKEIFSEESFGAFKDSFSYGSRSDMNFKFLKSLSNVDAALFFQQLMWKLGDAYDNGELDPIFKHIFEWQIRAYAGKSKWQYSDTPFASMRKPLSEARIGLIATSGHFVEGDDPKPFGVEKMSQMEAQERISDFLKGDPELSSIPVNIDIKRLRVRHGGYDIRAASEDPNTVLPIERLGEFESEGIIGQLSDDVYSFVGATAQSKLKTKFAPQWAEQLLSNEIDGMILVPV